MLRCTFFNVSNSLNGEIIFPSSHHLTIVLPWLLCTNLQILVSFIWKISRNIVWWWENQPCVNYLHNVYNTEWHFYFRFYSCVLINLLSPLGASPCALIVLIIIIVLIKCQWTWENKNNKRTIIMSLCNINKERRTTKKKKKPNCMCNIITIIKANKNKNKKKLNLHTCVWEIIR